MYAIERLKQHAGEEERKKYWTRCKVVIKNSQMAKLQKEFTQHSFSIGTTDIVDNDMQKQQVSRKEYVDKLHRCVNNFIEEKSNFEA